ncbi:glycoside hydrolase family 3 protein [Arcanobacterium hippocoleae]|uniref:glycoside hydrolase family 3 protein n=1 Tax=Arcanobacterium hippocoleae TaxID=149017 RepID=UPI003341BC9A
MKQPKLEVRAKQLIEVDGLKFKDLNGNGKLDPYEDWRLPYAERVKDLVSQMNLDEKVGMMLINTRFTGYQVPAGEPTSHDGIIDERVIEEGTNIFAKRKIWPTTHTINKLHLRHFILRDNYSPTKLARWNNAMNEICEASRLGIPCISTSNPRNENAEFVFGMNDAMGVFSTFPATMGIAAAVLGEKALGKDGQIFSDFAQAARIEWNAAGIRKGYMYMADVVTDPRWQRTYGTFGEDPELIADAMERFVDGFQGDELSAESISLTTKHFPGGGPRENGFDPHYKEGKWNCYRTPGSLEKYHLPGFLAALKSGSFMPYYSAPSISKSVVQKIAGQDVPFEEVGFAFNWYLLEEVLRRRFGFKGYVNSDSGITDNMCWGVEELSIPERFAKAINAGTDIVADTNNAPDLKTAIEKGWISMERVDEANSRLLLEMFQLGLFDERTYVDAEAADEIVANSPGWEKAKEVHRKSVVLMKNSNQTLPLAEGTKVYVQMWHKKPETSAAKTAEAREQIGAVPGLVIVDQPEDADVLFLMVDPQSGDYFNATPGLLELTICENKPLKAVDGTEYTETTVSGAEEFRQMARDGRARGQKVIISINYSLAWIIDDIEPLADALIGSFHSFFDAQGEVIAGKFKPQGKLPITPPASEAVIAVDEQGVCISPNDVPGYDKDQYLPAGMSYAYTDADGNVYRLGHGLTY